MSVLLREPYVARADFLKLTNIDVTTAGSQDWVVNLLSNVQINKPKECPIMSNH